MKLVLWLASMTILGVIVAFIGAASGTASSSLIWHMPTAYPISNYQTQNAVSFAKLVEECTDGGLRIVIHAGGSLFKGHQIKRVVRTGQVPIGERLLSAHSNENRLYAVDSIPFVASSFADARRLWTVARPAVEALLASEGLVLLYSVIWPPQGIYFRNEVTTVSEIRGMRFRAYNATTARVAELAGMIPVQIEAAEMSQALATGVVSSFMASGSSGYDSKVWEHVQYFYDAKAWLPRNSVFANRTEFDALPGKYQVCIKSAAASAEENGNIKATEMSVWYIEQLIKNGMTVIPPGAQFQKELANIGLTLASEWSEETGKIGRDILDAYRAASEDN